MADVRKLLAVGDAQIDAALAKCMGDYVHSESGGYPAYCSKDSPRRLLGEVEARLAACSQTASSRIDDHPDMVYPCEVARLLGVDSYANGSWVGNMWDLFVITTAPACMRARAALFLLDRPAAERLIAEAKERA